MKFFATIARAFMESRERQAARIIRDHSYLTHFEDRVVAETMNVVELAKPRPAHAAVAVELKQAA